MARRYTAILTVEFLRRRYVAEQATITELAAETGTSANTIYRALRRHHIELRGGRRTHPPDFANVLTADYLTAAYTEQQRSMEDIAGDVGCTAATVMRWLRHHNIPSRPARALQPVIYTDIVVDPQRTAAEAAGDVGSVSMTALNAYHRAGIRRPPGPRRMALDTDRIDELRAAGWTHQAIGAEVGCSAALVGKYLAGHRR